MVFVLVNAMLVIIDVGSGANAGFLGMDYAYWVILFWGFGIAGHAVSVLPEQPQCGQGVRGNGSGRTTPDVESSWRPPPDLRPLTPGIAAIAVAVTAGILIGCDLRSS